MTAAAFDLSWQRLGSARGQSYPVVDADIIYGGTMVTTLKSTGEAHPGTDAVDHQFVGIAKSQVDNTNDGETVVVDGSNDLLFWANAGTNLTPAVTDRGLNVYVEDDQTVTDYLGSTAKVYAGQIVDVDVANARVLVKSGAGLTGPTVTTFMFHVNLVDITTAGDVVTAFTPGFAGKIVKEYWVQGSPVTTASDAATLNTEIGTTNVTGSATVLTSATCTPLGKVIASTAITAANRFDADDTISVEAHTVTAFAEGDGMFCIVVEHE